MRRLLLAWAFALCSLGPQAAMAGNLGVCDEPADISAEQRDRLLRFGAIVKATLEDSGQRVALISRSGLDLARFGQRYSHAGLSLKGSGNTPWSVRQLYYACNEGRPRIFDQGIAGFLLGVNDPSASYVSMVFVPAAQAAPLEAAALDDRRAAAFLGSTYSANAFAFSTTYQNCNQWVAELLAGAWNPASTTRSEAQAWLQAQGYEPAVMRAGWMMGLVSFMPLLQHRDHPVEDLAEHRFRVSMPSSIEAFVRGTVPGATRIELCLQGSRVVLRRGWQPIDDGCRPAAGDAVTMLD